MTAEKKYPVITLDGPAGSGKSTMARYLANSLDGFAYLDTGALYRTLALRLIQNGFTPDDMHKSRAAVIESVGNAHMRAKFNKQSGGGFVQLMYLGPKYIPDQDLRSPDVSEMASACAVDVMTRRLANSVARIANRDQALIVDGRDAGTAIFPDAVLKFYLYAPAHDRAMRRMAQDADRGIRRSLDEVLKDMAIRDSRDSTREHDPLKFPADAIWIDTGLFLEDTEKRFLLDIARARLNPETARIV